MTISNRAFALAAATLALISAGSAAAQDNYDQGKSGPQLFASDCGICHQSPRGLMKTVNPSGLQSFLSVHYTASSQVAASIAAYLTSVDQGGPAPAPARARTAKKPKGAEAAKSGDKGAGEKKPHAKASDAKASDAKASDAKASDSKGSDAKPADSSTSDKP
jgi:mono/diheme cytochrome c family protein